MFDRDHDGLVSWEEVREIVFSLDFEFSEESLSQKIYDLIINSKKVDDEIPEGITFEQFLVLLSKEIKEKDLNASLIEAFKFLDK